MKSYLWYLWEIKNWIASLFISRTIGARALVIRGSKILLVKHSYIPLWHSIGGGVEKGETNIEAVERESFEEVGIICKSKPKLFNIYLNRNHKFDDYVVLYVIEDFTQDKVTSPEIIDSQWFDLKNLPQDISPATRRRVEEFLEKRELSEEW